jgi:2-methylisocitrate lyase-like PEP mutase family enzyme
MTSQTDKAIQFLQLHRGPDVLLLPNVWDVASARIIEAAGFPALATSSAGVAFSLGYPDGQHISREEMIARVARIVRAVNIPVSADLEAGYGSSAQDVATTAREMIQAGAVGMNLEDAVDDRLLELSLAVARVKAARTVAAELRVPIVVNARTDVYMFPGGDAETKYAEAERRLSAYCDAGANCVFAPGLKDAETIGRLARDLQCPLNILAGPGAPTVPELQRLGVARVSLGSGPMRAGLGLLRRLAEEVKTSGTYSALDGAVPHAEMNQLLSGKS